MGVSKKRLRATPKKSKNGPLLDSKQSILDAFYDMRDRHLFELQTFEGMIAEYIQRYSNVLGSKPLKFLKMLGFLFCHQFLSKPNYISRNAVRR